MSDIQTLEKNLGDKLQLAMQKLPDNCALIIRYAKAGLTDDEIWVLAAQKANASRVSNEWEGFFVSDLKHNNHIKQRYESLIDRIRVEQIKEQTKE